MRLPCIQVCVLAVPQMSQCDNHWLSYGHLTAASLSHPMHHCELMFVSYEIAAHVATVSELELVRS